MSSTTGGYDKRRASRNDTMHANAQTPGHAPSRIGFLDLPPEIRVMVYRELLVDPDGVHIKVQMSRHRRLIFHCHPGHATRKWEQEDRARKTCIARTRPPSYESLSGFVFRQHMGLSTVFDSDEATLKKLSHITYLQRLQRVDQGPWAVHKIRPAILATNRTVYEEAAYILYRQAFSFSEPAALFDFLAAMGPLPLRTIREINILGWEDKRTILSQATPAFALLPQVVSLRQLSIVCPMGEADWAWANIFAARKGDRQLATCHHQPADIIANKVYRDMMYWLRPTYAKLGIRGLQRVLRIHRMNFLPRFRIPDESKSMPTFTPDMEDALMVRFWGVLELLLEGDIA